MTEALHYRSIGDVAKSIRTGELSPVTLTETYLERIDSLNDSLHAFVEVTADDALRAAKTAETEIAAGNYRGPMHGIGFALKDNYDTQDVRTTACSKLFIDRVPEKDSTVSARFKAAGAVLLGKLTMSELAMVGALGSAKRRATLGIKRTRQDGPAVVQVLLSRQACARRLWVPTVVAPFDFRRLPIRLSVCYRHTAASADSVSCP